MAAASAIALAKPAERAGALALGIAARWRAPACRTAPAPCRLPALARAHRNSGQSGADGAGGAADRGNQQADAEDQAVAEQVAQLAAHQHQRAVDQHVADHQPLHVAQRQLEVAGDRRQRHVDGDVERRQRRAQPDDDKAELGGRCQCAGIESRYPSARPQGACRALRRSKAVLIFHETPRVGDDRRPQQSCGGGGWQARPALHQRCLPRKAIMRSHGAWPTSRRRPGCSRWRRRAAAS